MYINRVGTSHHPVTPTSDPIVGVDEHPGMNNDPSVTPTPAPLHANDRFDGTSLDGVNRIEKGGRRVGKNMLREFIRTPQALYINQYNDSTTMVPWGSIALRTEENLYRAEDPFVADSEIRTSITKQLENQQVREVVWTENAGIMEAGCGMYGTVCMPMDNPFGLGAAFNFGFDAVGLVVYRIIRPYQVGLNENAKHALQGITMELPWNIEAACKLSKGTEIQFVGNGKLSAFEGLIVFEGLSLPAAIGITTPGAAIYPIANQEISREYSLKILALDGEGKVRVTIEKIHAKSAGFTLRLMAGLLDPTNNALPQWGAGVLSYITQTAIENPMQNMLMNIWTVSLNGNLTFTSKDNNLYCFDLDLRNEKHHNAYKKLMRLNVKDAQILAADPASGVSKVEWTEHKYRVKRSVDVKAFAERLFLHEVSKSKRSGKLLRPDNSEVAYCDNIYRKKFLNFMTGRKDIRWQGIQLYDDYGKTKNYYAFSYEELDRAPHQQQVSRFFAFAKYLDISSEIEMHSDLVHLKKHKKYLSSKDDITTKIKLYFTEAGVQRILKASMEDGINAFIKTQSLINHEYALFPILQSSFQWARQQFDLYYFSRHSHRFIPMAPMRLRELKKHGKLSKLKKEYIKTLGRDFNCDFKLYLKARKFGHLIEKWSNASDEHNVSKFFTHIGKSHSFCYRTVIAALTEIAGRENLLVHSLSMIGGEVSIKSVDEGEIIHPRDEAWELVNRAISPPRITAIT